MDAAKLISEVKRRRVFRVLLGYGIVSFAVLQIVEPIMHALHLPDAVLTYTVLALALGFPVTIDAALLPGLGGPLGRAARRAPGFAEFARKIGYADL